MKIVTWNINGIKAPIDNLLLWLRESAPEGDSLARTLQQASEGGQRPS